MNPSYFRRLAQRCRELIPETRTEAVKRQLTMWIDEFEARAREAEQPQTAGAQITAATRSD